MSASDNQFSLTRAGRINGRREKGNSYLSYLFLLIARRQMFNKTKTNQQQEKDMKKGSFYLSYLFMLIDRRQMFDKTKTNQPEEEGMKAIGHFRKAFCLALVTLLTVGVVGNARADLCSSKTWSGSWTVSWTVNNITWTVDNTSPCWSISDPSSYT